MKDPLLNYVITCEQVISDKSGINSLINIFNRVNAQSFPSVHPGFTLIINIKGDPGIYPIKVELVNTTNEGDMVTLLSYSSKIQQGKDGANVMAKLSSVPFKEEGRYWIKVIVQDKVLSRPELHYVTVRKKQKISEE